MVGRGPLTAARPAPHATARRGASVARAVARRPTLTASLLYACLAVLLVGQGLLPGRTLSSSDYLYTAAPWSHSVPDGVRRFGANGELADAVAAFQPFLRYTRRSLPDVPRWNPYVGAGRPFAADAQSAILSPFSAPAYVLPFGRSLAVIAALKVFVAALGMFLLARALALRLGGALLAGLVFGFGLLMVTWLAWPLSSVWALVPWLLLATERVVRRPRPRAVAALAAVVALQFLAGHPESSFHALVAALAFLALRLGLARRGAAGGVRVGRVLAGWGLGLVAGAGIAAVALVPFVELLLHSSDLAQRGAEHPVHLPAKFLFTVLLSDYWGRPTGTALAPFVNSRAFYVGGLTLMLALAALLRRPVRERVWVAAFGAFGVAMVIGLPPLFGLVTGLPGFHTAHNTRLILFFLLSVALLAGWGLDDLCDARPPARRRRALIAGSAALLLVPILAVAAAGRLSPGGIGTALSVAWGFATPPSDASAADVVPLAALLVWLPVAATGVALLAARLGGRLGPNAFAGLAVALVAVDLFRAGMGQNPAIPDAHAVQPTTGAIRYLQSRRPYRFAGLVPDFGITPLPANVAMDYGLYDARSYDYPVERRYDRFWRATVAPRVPFVPPTTLAAATPRALRGLSLLSVADVIQQPADRPVRLPGLRVAYRGPDATVYANRGALPRVFLAGSQLPVGGGDAALAAVTAPGFDARKVAVTERALPGVPLAAGGLATPPAGGARLTRYSPERVEARVDARRPGLLVLTDISFPGWQATVDGRPAPVERVDYLLRAVRVGPGRHRVELSYAPSSWRLGWIVSLGSLVLVAAAAALDGHIRRRPATRRA